MKEEVWEEVAAYKFLKNADTQRYRQVIKHSKERKSIGKKEFPKTLKARISSMQKKTQK